MTDSNRKEEYEKDEWLEHILQSVNRKLSPVEDDLIGTFENPSLPIIFVVGAQRSGTTLLMQLLTERFQLSYPTNFIARFWSCPYIGAQLYRSFDFDKNTKSFRSDLGYTKGLDGPHEFGYFWKRWFPWQAYEKFDYDKIAYSHLKKELAAWQSVQHRPLIFKNLIDVTYHLIKIHELFSSVFFLNIERDDIYTIQSTYRSRLKLYGSEEQWFGIRPKVYKELLSLPVIDQIVRQVCYVKKDIRDQLEEIPTDRYLSIQYSELIESPNMILDKIKNLVSKEFNFEIKSELTSELENQNVQKVDDDTFDDIKKIYNEFVI